ncbi:MAG: hypothetical protein JWQ35_25 [Bacteriovoracaceae bacterium]|nr:hypothetical protein [Bacteriovoracaceae bacterium]
MKKLFLLLAALISTPVFAAIETVTLKAPEIVSIKVDSEQVILSSKTAACRIPRNLAQFYGGTEDLAATFKHNPQASIVCNGETNHALNDIEALTDAQRISVSLSSKK